MEHYANSMMILSIYNLFNKFDKPFTFKEFHNKATNSYPDLKINFIANMFLEAEVYELIEQDKSDSSQYNFLGFFDEYDDFVH